jgi:hypothetical protein
MEIVLPKMTLRLDLDCRISQKSVKFNVNYRQKLCYQENTAVTAWISTKLIILIPPLCVDVEYRRRNVEILG